MAQGWTDAHLARLTTDPGTIRDGRQLGASNRWSNTGIHEQLVWGECKGSGKDPYRICLDIGALAHTCSCPSRKHPCKHIVGLAFLFDQHPQLFTSPIPDWVNTWLEGRSQRQKTAPAQPIDPAVAQQAQAERALAREAKVAAGIQELALWLRDLMRRGLADDRIRTYAFWDGMAARMVDAQAPGLARRLRDCAAIPFQGRADWADRLLDQVACLYLVTDAFQRIETLPPETQADMRAFIGWPQKQETLRARSGVFDQWRVMSQTQEIEDRLRARRVWLHGLQTGRRALLLDFAFGNTPFEDSFTLGRAFSAELVFYPGSHPQRAIVKQRGGYLGGDMSLYAGFDSTGVAAALDYYARALARNPWLESVPVGFRAATPYAAQGRYFLRDSVGAVLPLSARPHPWFFTAVSGNGAIPIFGEWDGCEFAPSAVVSDGLVYPC